MSDLITRLRHFADGYNDVPDDMLIEAADEIERLRSLCSHAGILSAQDQHNAMMAAKDAEIERLRAELDDERMRHAACGVVALSNTPASATAQRQMLPKYRSASVEAVMDAVDREMALRAAAQQARAALSDLIATRDPKVYSDALRALDEVLGEQK